MEVTSLRLCQREGCEEDLDALGLKSTARFCSITHRREQNRLTGDGKPERKWIAGHWTQPSRKRSGISRRPRKLIPGVDLTSPVMAALDAFQAGTGGP